MNKPLVTCLCLTMKGRRKYLDAAIGCFLAQTYKPREIMIVADSESDVGDLASRFDLRGHGVEGCSMIVPPRRLNIGQKRNLGCESAQGDLIAIWDDDDYSAPGRLGFQVNSMAVSRKSVTGFQLMKFTDGTAWWQFALPHGLVHGASLCFTRDWWKANPFPEVNIGEDAAFCERAAVAGQLAQCPDMDLMYASIHPGNTSKKNVLQPGWLALPGYQWKE